MCIRLILQIIFCKILHYVFFDIIISISKNGDFSPNKLVRDLSVLFWICIVAEIFLILISYFIYYNIFNYGL